MVVIKLFTEAKQSFALAFTFKVHSHVHGPDHPLSVADCPSSAPHGLPVLFLQHFPWTAIDAQMELVREQCQAAIAHAISRCPLLRRKNIRVPSLQDSLIIQEAKASFVQTMWPLLGSAALDQTAASTMDQRAEARSYFATLCEEAPATEPPTPDQLQAKRHSVTSTSTSVGYESDDEPVPPLDKGPTTFAIPTLPLLPLLRFGAFVAATGHFQSSSSVC